MAQLRRGLARRGFRWLLRHRLEWPGASAGQEPLQVVKVVVPGCEMLEPHNRRIGPRLMARLAGHG